jgi:hypothetical protein
MKCSAAVLFLALVAACGDDAPAQPDAAVIPDAPAPDAAPVCANPNKMCGSTCLDVTGDEENCGDCGVTCKGGEACDSACACAPDFIPATIEPGSFDQFQGAMGVTIAIGPTFGSGGINPVVLGYNAATPIGTDIDLSTIALGGVPFVGAAYRFNINTMATDARFVVTAGTLHLTKACDTEVEGTLTNATFSGINGDLMDPQIDPLGCTKTVPTMTFHIMTAACP